MSESKFVSGDKLLVVTAQKESDDVVSYEKRKLSDVEFPEFEVAVFAHNFLMDSYRKLMGRTLTIIDASVADPRQNKAMKDLLRSVFSDEMEFTAKFGFNQQMLEEMVPENIDEVESVSIEEALGVAK